MRQLAIVQLIMVAAQPLPGTLMCTPSFWSFPPKFQRKVPAQVQIRHALFSSARLIRKARNLCIAEAPTLATVILGLLGGVIGVIMPKSAGDPCAPVAAAADAAIASLCAACGYSGGLGQLISENADYVVDGVCARLRALDANSRCNAETRCDCSRIFKGV